MLAEWKKNMLDVQYRSPRELNAFPSKEFYEDKLKTSKQNAEITNFLALSRFRWPVRNGTVIPTVFSAEKMRIWVLAPKAMKVK